MQEWQIKLDDEVLDHVFFVMRMDSYDVRQSLIKYEGYDSRIKVYAVR